VEVADVRVERAVRRDSIGGARANLPLVHFAAVFFSTKKTCDFLFSQKIGNSVKKKGAAMRKKAGWRFLVSAMR
jgi:hypothetical protein